MPPWAPGIGAAVPGRHHCRVLVPAQRRTGTGAESVRRDTEVVQQQLRLRLVENQEQLLRMAREISLRQVNPEQFMHQASDFVRARPEIISLTWMQADASVKATHLALNVPMQPMGWTWLTTGKTCTTRCSKPWNRKGVQAGSRTQPAGLHAALYQPVGVQSHLAAHPLIDRSGFNGTLVAEYSLEALMRYLVPRDGPAGTP